MPDKKTIKKTQEDKRQEKSPSTQAGEFVKEEIDKIRAGKHGVKNTKQAIAIGLSQARRSGVALPTPAGEKPRSGRIVKPKVSAKRSKAAVMRLKGKSPKLVSTKALSKQAKKSARTR